MSLDLRPLLGDWEFQPDQFQARIIVGADQIERIQIRIDLGILQLELTGRPDGARPNGFESLLDYHEHQAELSSQEPYVLETEDCVPLLREGVQYYHRYLAAFHLGRHDLVIRDTERNLRLFAFVRQHARRERDKLEFDQYRPYVLMMNTRSRAAIALNRQDHRAALEAIDQGIEQIRQFLKDYLQEDQELRCGELQFLLRLRSDLLSERDRGPLARLEEQLDLSVKLERYEEAARLRDLIRQLRGGNRDLSLDH